MTAQYSYLIADLLSDTTLEELPLDCQSFETRLKGYGELRADLSLLIDDVRALDLRSLLAFGERALYALRGDEILWGGVLWRGTPNDDATAISLQAMEFESYFARRLLTADYRPTQVDQLDIARALITTAQAEAGGNLRIVLAGDLSGVLRDRQYLAKDLPVVDDLLRQLADVEGGFDYTITTVQDSGGDRTRLLRFGYPRLGRSADDSGLVFDASISTFVPDYDAFASATEQHEHGASVGEGDLAAPLHAVARDEAGLGRGLPLLQTAASDHSTVIEQPTLDAYARADLAGAPVPITTYRCTVRGDGRSSADPTKLAGEPMLGQYGPGDEALFEVTNGWFPERPDGSPGLSLAQRLLAVAVTPSSDSVALTLGPTYDGSR